MSASTRRTVFFRHGPKTTPHLRSLGRSMTSHRRQAPAPAAAKPPQMIKIMLSAKSSSGKSWKSSLRACALNEPTRLRSLRQAARSG